MKLSVVLYVVIAVLLAGAGAYWYLTEHPHAPTSLESLPKLIGDGTDVSKNLILGFSSNGYYLTAYNGMTVYSYKKDTRDTSYCLAACAAVWPPYTVRDVSDIHVPSILAKQDVGTIVRSDHSLQVTYRGHPLYFYSRDSKPGDAFGDKKDNEWFVVEP